VTLVGDPVKIVSSRTQRSVVAAMVLESAK
jgi:hypothetical protein